MTKRTVEECYDLTLPEVAQSSDAQRTQWFKRSTETDQQASALLSLFADEVLLDIAKRLRYPYLLALASTCTRLWALYKPTLWTYRIKTHRIDRTIGLTDEQARAFKAAAYLQKNVFISGLAGTGKTRVLREIIAALTEHHQRQSVVRMVICAAPTGVAAERLGGTTLHQLFGTAIDDQCGTEDTIPRSYFTSIASSVGVLVIDEVSMMSKRQFENINLFINVWLSIPPDKRRPFGGIQVIMCGDFHQLSPIGGGDSSSSFCFESLRWNYTFSAKFYFQEVMRQDSRRFSTFLNAVRCGSISTLELQLLQTMQRRPFIEGAVSLYCINRLAAERNKQEMKKLVGKPRIYTAQDKGTVPVTVLEEELVLKRGARVMLRKNYSIQDSLVNGSCGTVVGFVKTDDVAAHACIDSSDIIEYSRAKRECISTARGEEQNDDDDEQSDTSAQEVAYCATLMSFSGINVPDRFGFTASLPVVRFDCGQVKIVTPCTITRYTKEIDSYSNTISEYFQGSRTQLPLSLAYAFTIHKAQGITLQAANLFLGDAFAPGQCYVALSRVSCMDNIHIGSLRPERITASRKVTEFYQELATEMATAVKRK